MSSLRRESIDAPRAALRVILVGRTGLDVGLRREPMVELVRVSTALEAVGELASPIDGESPRRCAIVVARDADPGRASESTAPASAAGPAAEFVAALRSVDPGTAVLLLDESRRGQTPAGPYDVAVGVEDGLERIRRLAARMATAQDGAAGRTGEAPSLPPGAPPGQPAARPPLPSAERTVATTSPRVVTEPKPTMPVARDTGRSDRVAPSAALVHGATDDAAMVEAVLAGRAVIEPALVLIRQRLGVDPHAGDVRFVPTEAGPADLLSGAAGTVAETSVPVAHRGRPLGTLRTTNIDGQRLASHASWLAGWLTLAEQQAALRQAAMLDDLTGAYNRRYFQRYAQTALDQAQRDRNSVTLLLFDIDNFKNYNDRFGHAAGDEILRETVKLLRSTIRPHDRVCRIGGDEFAVVFYEPAGPREPRSKPPETVHQIARRFQEQIRQHRFPKLGGLAPGTLTVSGGLATYPWDGRTVQELMERADALALESKRSGKNVITIGPGDGTHGRS
jgi:diguanylate cyclase (GGDEF)-like protein